MVRAAAAVAAVLSLSGATAFQHLAAGRSGSESDLDASRITCPVVASLWTGGDLVTDDNGNVELEDLLAAVRDGLGAAEEFADFLAVFFSAFHTDDKDTESYRDRCLYGFTDDGAACAANREKGYSTEADKRWVNIFEMHGKHSAEHGISTTIRGAMNTPELDSPCNGTYPCEAEFQKFIVDHANADGRFYLGELESIMCHARAEGDLGGETSYSQKIGLGLEAHWPGLVNVTAYSREWQLKAAFIATLVAFGRTEVDRPDDLFLTLNDTRALFMESRYPDDWEKREWGCLFSGCGLPAIAAINHVLPCSEEVEWWEGTYCEIATGDSCSDNNDCSGGSSCFRGKCLCGADANGIGMCIEDGVCVERATNCMYFGEPCVTTPAHNPEAQFWLS